MFPQKVLTIIDTGPHNLIVSSVRWVGNLYSLSLMSYGVLCIIIWASCELRCVDRPVM